MKTRHEKNWTSSLAKTSNLIRSLRDDEQGKAQISPGNFKWLRTHDESEWSLNTFADVAFWSSISRTRWTFLEENVPVVVSLMVPLVTPVNEVQMKPRVS